MNICAVPESSQIVIFFNLTNDKNLGKLFFYSREINLLDSTICF
jgi:hypothetical protein